MSTMNIWAMGPDPKAEALEVARELGYKDPVVARTLTVNGQQFAGVAVIVAEGQDEADAHAQARRRRRQARNGGEQ
jgi:prolyl-tRNA editing enzyme YbaK/EbsC (Cys-tRNA(Pro) deacylase)